MKTYTNKELTVYIDHAVLDLDVIEIAKDDIHGSELLLCVVLDFLFGSYQSFTKIQQCRDVIRVGGIFEIDMVDNYDIIKKRDFDYISEEMRQVSEISHQKS